jgi:hypothetical protein
MFLSRAINFAANASRILLAALQYRPDARVRPWRPGAPAMKSGSRLRDAGAAPRLVVAVTRNGWAGPSRP